MRSKLAKVAGFRQPPVMIGKIALLMVVATGFAVAGVEDRVAAIRKWYAQIEAAKADSTKSLKFDAAENGPFSGDAVIRWYPGGLASVTVNCSYGDHDSQTDHYYYRNGKLFFMYQVATYWQFSEGSTDTNPKTKDTRTEGRYYFDGDTCVRQLMRTATSSNGEELAKILSKKEQTSQEPDPFAASLPAKAAVLLDATRGQEIIDLYLSEEGGC
jgi:hypothetical protein